MAFMYIFAHTGILRRKRRGIQPKEIQSRLAGEPTVRCEVLFIVWFPDNTQNSQHLTREIDLLRVFLSR